MNARQRRTATRALHRHPLWKPERKPRLDEVMEFRRLERERKRLLALRRNYAVNGWPEDVKEAEDW